MPKSMIFEERVIDEPHAIVDNVADTFSKVFSVSSPETNDLFIQNPTIDTLTIREVDESAVLAAIRKLKSTMTMDPDLIPSAIIRDCATVFTPILAYIFKLVLQTCRVPSGWKISKVYLFIRFSSNYTHSNFC